ncbi:DoxX family protein [Algibacter sp. L4_22]|uniref:DoxX family protein n=1 Tax=unclassified Algibacter TaxID=2615009 RepID=UPI00131DADB5|nr:DoxX family protein [Algibacter sp. L4_22]
MKILHTTLIILSAISFLFYGYGCLFSYKMKQEFLRFQLSEKQRKITGILQILAGLALLYSFVNPLLGVIATMGLTIQMLLGFLVRLKIKDPFILALPSFVFMIFNGYLFFYFLKIYL